VIAFLQQMSGEPITVSPSEITQASDAPSAPAKPAQTAAVVPIHGSDLN
jgi:hypothetical protein